MIALLAVAALAAIAATGVSQTAAQKKHKPASGAAARRAAALRAAADSAAEARADSLRRAVAAAEADSARRADSVAAAREAEAKFQLRVIPNLAFGLGERLVFDVNYGFITAGEATLQVAGTDTLDGRVCYRIEFRVNSLPSFAWIYRVVDRYVTYIDEETIAPWKFEQHVREGSYSRDFTAAFDQRKHIATTSEGTYPIPPYVHDILSAFYFARTLDYGPMKPGDQVQMYNFYKDKTYELGVRFLGRQDLDVAAGTFKTVVIEPLVKEGGLIKSEGRIVIWLTDDDRKIPVRVNTKVVIGSIDTELREYAGVRGPVTSRVK